MADGTFQEGPGVFAEARDALARMVAAHMARPFPRGFRGRDVEDQDMVMLDADAYAYSANVLKGPLTDKHRADFERLVAVFDKVLAAIEDAYALDYYTRLRDTAVLALEVETLRRK
ncbi:hypothetical protein [Streptomyces sp. NPDC018584]|uniref:hypothetical protein n=1 Tax=unclassified Streptomyces TaxID=2593676 RepID=UPI0037A3B438